MFSKTIKRMTAGLFVIAVFIMSGCKLVEMDLTPAYTWALGSEGCTFKVTKATINGVDQNIDTFTQSNLAYSTTDFSDYLSFSFDGTEYTQIILTVTDYKGGGASYKQWLGIFKTFNGTWIVRPDAYSNVTSDDLPYTTYNSNYGDGYENTNTNTAYWDDQTFDIYLTWDPDNNFASVYACNTTGSKWYAAAASNSELFVASLGLASCDMTVSSINYDGKEMLSAPKSYTSAYNYTNDMFRFNPYCVFKPTSDHTITYTVSSFTPGTTCYNQWISYIAHVGDSNFWILRPDYYSNMSLDSFGTASYSGTNTWTDVSAWSGGFTLIQKWSASSKTLTVTCTNGTNTYTATAVKN